jgi:hypothetical protein
MKNRWLDVNRDQNNIFKRIFNKDLSTYFSGVTGLDIVKLDEDLFGKNNPKQMKECIEKTYGIKATELIEELLSI